MPVNPYFAPLPRLRMPRMVPAQNIFAPLQQGIRSALDIAQTVPRIQYMRQLGEESRRRMQRQEALERAFRREDPREIMALSPQLGMQYNAYLRKMSQIDQRENIEATNTALGMLERVGPYIRQPEQLYPLKRRLTRMGAGFLSDIIGDPARFIKDPAAWQDFITTAPERLQEMRNVMAGEGLAVQREQLRARERQFGRGLELRERELRQRGLIRFRDPSGGLHWLERGEPIPRGWEEDRPRAAPDRGRRRLETRELLEQMEGITEEPLAEELMRRPSRRPTIPFKTRQEFEAAGFDPRSWRGSGYYKR